MSIFNQPPLTHRHTTLSARKPSISIRFRERKRSSTHIFIFPHCCDWRKTMGSQSEIIEPRTWRTRVHEAINSPLQCCCTSCICERADIKAGGISNSFKWMDGTCFMGRLFWLRDVPIFWRAFYGTMVFNFKTMIWYLFVMFCCSVFSRCIRRTVGWRQLFTLACSARLCSGVTCSRIAGCEL